MSLALLQIAQTGIGVAAPQRASVTESTLRTLRTLRRFGAHRENIVADLRDDKRQLGGCRRACAVIGVRATGGCCMTHNEHSVCEKVCVLPLEIMRQEGDSRHGLPMLALELMVEPSVMMLIVARLVFWCRGDGWFFRPCGGGSVLTCRMPGRKGGSRGRQSSRNLVSRWVVLRPRALERSM